MTAELGLCLMFMVVALPASRSIAAHYLVFAVANLATLGVTEMDSSILSMMFVVLAVADAVLFLYGGRAVLLISAAASSALAIESMLNMDWLLNNVANLSAAINAIIAANLIQGYLHWTHGK